MASPTLQHLDCGSMCPIAAPLVGSPGALWSRGSLVCHCILIETDSRLVLVDTGLGSRDLAKPSRLPATFRWAARPSSSSVTALEHVRALGHDPADVTDIVLTHLDLDHAGGLCDFPKARVHVHGLELDAASAPRLRMETHRYVPGQWSHSPMWQRYDELGESWFGFEAVRAVGKDAEILLVPLIGHTRGHAGVAIRQGERWLLHAGDAFFHREELLDPRRCPFGLRIFQTVMQADKSARLANASRLREVHAQHADQVTIVCSHDVEQLAQCRGSMATPN